MGFNSGFKGLKISTIPWREEILVVQWRYYFERAGGTVEILFLQYLYFCLLRNSSCPFFRPSWFFFVFVLSFFFFLPFCSRGNVVGTLIRLQAGRPGARTLAGTMNVPVFQNVGTVCGANQASQSMGIVRFFLGGKSTGERSWSLISSYCRG